MKLRRFPYSIVNDDDDVGTQTYRVLNDDFKNSQDN